LAFDIGFALPRAPIKGLRRALSEEERRAIAKSIVEHLKLCGWKFQMTPVDEPIGEFTWLRRELGKSREASP
jgi:hypothetical protein